MKFKTTWILLGALIVIVVFFLLVEENQRTSKIEDRREKRKLLPYGPNDVQWFVLINPDGERIEMQRRGDDWMVTYPTVTLGSKSTIDIVLKQIVPGYRLEEFGEVSNLADFGLDEPFATLIISSRTRFSPDTIFIGDKTPTGSNSYVRLGGSRDVILAREMTHNAAKKNLYHLRDKHFVHFGIEAIDELTVRKGTARVHLTRDGRYWWLDDPRYRVDNAVVEQHCNELTRAVIYEFVREDTDSLELFGFEAQRGEIVLFTGSDTVEVRFGSRKGNRVYAVRSGVDKVLLLDETVEGMLDLAASEIRDMNLTFFDVSAVKSFSYETGDTTVAFEAAGGRWNIRGPDVMPAETYMVNSFLRALKAIEFTEIIEEPFPADTGGFESADLKLTLWNYDGEIVDVVTVTAPGANYEIGASFSANARGRLAAGTRATLHHLFERIGSAP